MRERFARFASTVAKAAGHPYVFVLACTTVLAWAITGPVFRFSETWQLIINTGTTIITFLMVFLIQNSQNRDSEALQLKLDEIIFALHNADNEMIDIESLDPQALDALKVRYEGLLHRVAKRTGKTSHATSDRRSRAQKKPALSRVLEPPRFSRRLVDVSHAAMARLDVFA